MGTKKTVAAPIGDVIRKLVTMQKGSTKIDVQAKLVAAFEKKGWIKIDGPAEAPKG